MAWRSSSDSSAMASLTSSDRMSSHASTSTSCGGSLRSRSWRSSRRRRAASERTRSIERLWASRLRNDRSAPRAGSKRPGSFQSRRNTSWTTSSARSASTRTRRARPYTAAPWPRVELPQGAAGRTERRPPRGRRRRGPPTVDPWVSRSAPPAMRPLAIHPAAEVPGGATVGSVPAVRRRPRAADVAVTTPGPRSNASRMLHRAGARPESSVWSSPSPSVARAVMLWFPGVASQGSIHWRHVSPFATSPMRAGCHGPSSMRTSTWSMPRWMAHATPPIAVGPAVELGQAAGRVDPGEGLERSLLGVAPGRPVGVVGGEGRQLQLGQPLRGGVVAVHARARRGGPGSRGRWAAARRSCRWPRGRRDRP